MTTRAWVKLDDHMDEHSKFIGASDLSFALAVKAIMYSHRINTDGFLPAGGPARLLREDPADAVADLIDSGFWAAVDGGWQIKNYEYWQQTREMREKQRRDGAKGGRAKAAGHKGISSKALAKAYQSSTKPRIASTEVEVEGEVEREDTRSNTNVTSKTDVTRSEGDSQESQPRKAAPKKGDDPEFDHFWDAYPKRNGKSLHRGKAAAAWGSLSKDKQARARVGVGHYRTACDSGVTLAKDAFRWLRDEAFDDWQTPAAAAAAQPQPPVSSPSSHVDWVDHYKPKPRSDEDKTRTLELIRGIKDRLHEEGLG